MNYRWLLAPALILLLPAVALAIDLYSAGGFRFDVGDTWGGELTDGTSDAYDGAFTLTVNGTAYNVGGAASSTTLGGRNVVMASTSVGGLSVQRQVYVPASGGDYARFLDVVANPGASAASVTLQISGNLGSDGSTVLYDTSSGDTLLTTADTWFGTDDTDGSGDPSLAHVLQGTSPRIGATTATLSGDNFSWTFATSVPPGGRIAILTFAIQKGSRAEAAAEARRLVEAPDDALTGLDDHLDDIINFSIAEPGAPRVRFGGPFTIPEGQEAVISVTVEDLEGDTVEWSWDTDDDGVFGELPGATSYTIPAGTTDGDGVLRLGVRASDGTNTTERYRTVSITNVAPTITSSPGLITSVGARYRYQIEVVDPAGALDPPTYAIVTGPSSMGVSAGGLVTWTPRDTDVTAPDSPLRIEVGADDGDGGVATQRWDLVVSPNRAPTDPTPVFPIGGIGLLDPEPRLVVSNATDMDRDPLVYFFELDTVPTFDSPDLVASGGIDQMPGITFWYVPAPLRPGRHHWRVWVSDGTVETEPRKESFYVVPDPSSLPDAGPAPDGGAAVPDGGTEHRRDDDSGCAAAGPGAGGGALPLFLWLGAALLWRSGRRALR